MSYILFKFKSSFLILLLRGSSYSIAESLYFDSLDSTIVALGLYSESEQVQRVLSLSCCATQQRMNSLRKAAFHL